MKDRRRYIAVDKDEVMRCSWCGTTESTHWIRGKERGIYCCSTCKTADTPDCNGICMLALAIGVISGSLSSFRLSDSPIVLLPTVLFGFLLLLILGKSYVVIKARSKVPRNSRLHDELFDERYLRCENCGAPLEILDGAVSVECSYCGYMNRVSYEE